MADTENIGGVSVQIVGNYAPLLKDIETAVQVAQKGGGDIAAGLNKGAAAAGEFEQKISALVASGATLAEALSRVQSGTAAMASGIGSAGAAAQTAAVQLKLFDEAAMVPYADAAGQLNLFSDELEPIANEAARAAVSVEQFTAAERHAGDEAAQSASRLDQFKASVGAFTSQLQAGAGGLITIGGMLTAAVTVPLVGIAAAALKVSGELEQSRVAFTTMLGSAKAAQEHLDKLKAFAASTPFEFPDLVQASKRLQALGFAAKEVIPTLTAVGNAASALGSGAEGIHRITTALGQMQMATRVTAQDMRQLTEAGIPAWQMLAKTLNTDVAGAMALVEKRAVESATAVPALLAGMNEKFAGLMEAQSKTLLGAWSNFKDKVTFTLMDIGDTIAPLAKRILDDGLMPLLDWGKSLADAFAHLSPPMQNIILGFGAIAAAAGPLLVALGGMGFAITQISAAIPILTTIAGGLASVVGVLLVGAIAAAIFAFADLNTAMAANARKYDETEKQFQKYIAKLIEGAKTGDQMAAAEEKVKLALEAGALSKAQAVDILEKLAAAQKKVVGVEWSKAAAEMGIAFTILKSGTEGALSTTEAFAVKLKALRDEVNTTRAALDTATVKYQDHKATARDVAKAYDDWQGATSALASAQKVLLPVVTNVHHATKEFVDVAARQFPDAAKVAANATEAFAVKLGMQNEQLAIGQKYLDAAMDRWRQYHDNAGEVSKALDALQRAQAAVNKEIGDLPTVTLKEFTDHMDKVGMTADRGIPALQRWLTTFTTAVPGIKDTTSLLRQMGIVVEETGDLIASKLIARYEQLSDRQITLEEEALAWGKISGAVNKLAQTDLPAALKLYDEHYARLVRSRATQQELLEAEGKRLQLEIAIEAQTGASATKQIIGLQNVKIAQGLLYDQTHLLGDLYVNVTNDILKGFDELGKSVADAIFDSKNLGDAFIETGKKIGKTILEDIIGTYFKALKDEILKSTGLLNGLTQSLAKFFGAPAKGAAAVAADDAGPLAAKTGGAIQSGASSAAGAASTLGIVGAVASIGQLISSIVGNFQMAKMETSLNAIEHNTRFLEIIFQKFAEVDEWERHAQIMEALGNIFTRLGEVGVGVVQAVAETSAEVVDSIRRGFHPDSGSAREKTPLQPYEFKTPDAIANAILNGLIRGGGPPAAGAFGAIQGMAEGGPVAGDGIRFLHDGEFVVPRAQVPQMQAMSAPAAARVASVSINSGSNTFHIYEAANPRETARQVAEFLKILSPRFAAFAQ